MDSLSFISHGMFQDVIDYTELIKDQASIPEDKFDFITYMECVEYLQYIVLVKDNHEVPIDESNFNARIEYAFKHLRPMCVGMPDEEEQVEDNSASDTKVLGYGKTK